MSELVGIAYGVDFLRNPSKRVHGRRDLEQGRWHIYELQKHAAFADQSAWLPVGGSPLSAASRLSMLLPIPHYRGYLADTVPAGRENHCLQLRLRHTSDCIASMRRSPAAERQCWSFIVFFHVAQTVHMSQP